MIQIYMSLQLTYSQYYQKYGSGNGGNFKGKDAAKGSQDCDSPGREADWKSIGFILSHHSDGFRAARLSYDSFSWGPLLIQVQYLLESKGNIMKDNGVMQLTIEVGKCTIPSLPFREYSLAVRVSKELTASTSFKKSDQDAIDFATRLFLRMDKASLHSDLRCSLSLVALGEGTNRIEIAKGEGKISKGLQSINMLLLYDEQHLGSVNVELCISTSEVKQLRNNNKPNHLKTYLPRQKQSSPILRQAKTPEKPYDNSKTFLDSDMTTKQSGRVQSDLGKLQQKDIAPIKWKKNNVACTRNIENTTKTKQSSKKITPNPTVVRRNDLKDQKSPRGTRSPQLIKATLSPKFKIPQCKSVKPSAKTQKGKVMQDQQGKSQSSLGSITMELEELLEPNHLLINSRLKSR